MSAHLQTCSTCEKDFSITLFSEGDPRCPNCKADALDWQEAARSTEVKPKTNEDIAKRTLAERALARRRLLAYIEAMVPGYKAGWVHRDICQRLEKFCQDVVDQKSPRLILAVPPRHGKSTIGSVNMPAWHLGRYPDHEVISCSYAESLALDFSRKCRTQVSSSLYKAIFNNVKGARLDPTAKSAANWLTQAGGGYLAAGVGGGITGKGANILIIDDPVKNRVEAESQLTRDTNWDWYTSTAYTRLATGGGVLVIMTRWHDDDLAGRLLQKQYDGMGDSWEKVRYPAVAEDDEEFRGAGEALHPERYDLEALNRIRRAVGPRDWEALYQQNPVASDGDFFTVPMIKYYDTSTIDLDRLEFYQAWDLAIGKAERNDYTVGMTVGVDEEDNMFLVDLVRGRLDGLEIVEAVLDMYELWEPRVVGIEKGHINMALGPLLEKRKAERNLYGCYIKELTAGRRDKELRARTIQGRMEQGKVLFPYNEAFTKDLVSELLRFPNGVHDDQVDALAWLGLMMSEFAAFYAPPEPKKASWRDNITQFTSKRSRRRTAMSA